MTPDDTSRRDRFVSRDGDFTVRRAAGKGPLEAADQQHAKALHRLSDLRRRRAVTQNELAQRTGRTQDQISRLERRDDPQLSSVLDYLKGLDATNIELAVTFKDGDRATVSLLPASGTRARGLRGAANTSGADRGSD